MWTFYSENKHYIWMIILLQAPFPDTSYKLCYLQVCDETLIILHLVIYGVLLCY